MAKKTRGQGSGSALLQRLARPVRNQMDGPGKPKRGDSKYWKRVAAQHER